MEKPHVTDHHLIPRSRGGPNGWNKKGALSHRHLALHLLFGNLFPNEMVTIIARHWTGKNRRLRYEKLSDRQVAAWVLLFGEGSIDNTDIAINEIRSHWDFSEEQKKEYEKHLRLRNTKMGRLVKQLRKYARKGDSISMLLINGNGHNHHKPPTRRRGGKKF